MSVCAIYETIYDFVPRAGLDALDTFVPNTGFRVETITVLAIMDVSMP